MVVTCYFVLEIDYDLFNEILLNKLSTPSGTARIYSIQYAFDYFMTYPILGVGWGYVTSFDLIFSLLAGVGLFGLFFFVLAFYIPLKPALFPAKRTTLVINSTPISIIGQGISISLVLILLLSILGGIELYLLYIYFMLGLIYSVNYLRTNNAANELGCMK